MMSATSMKSKLCCAHKTSLIVFSLRVLQAPMANQSNPRICPCIGQQEIPWSLEGPGWQIFCPIHDELRMITNSYIPAAADKAIAWQTPWPTFKRQAA